MSVKFRFILIYFINEDVQRKLMQVEDMFENKSNNSLVDKLLKSQNKNERHVRFQTPSFPSKGKTFLSSTSLANIRDGDHHALLGKYAVNLWREKAMTDVLIVVQNNEFKTHKAVLACYSPYFAEVLVRPGFNDVHYLQLPNVSARAFAILLEYMYTGKLKVTCQELNDVYRSAKKLGMIEAQRKCIELFRVDPDNFQNVVYLYVASRKLGTLDASERAFKLMQEHFERLVTTDEFLDLEPQQVMELLKSDEIGARSEIIVFLAALKWINYKYIEREEHIIPILNCVRFPLMTMEEILACYHPPVLSGIVNIPTIRAALLSATCYICAKSLHQEHLFLHLGARPRTFLFSGEPVVLWDVSIFDQNKYQENRRVYAATKIQAAIRGHLFRKRFKEDFYIANYSATVIQSAFRGYYTRRALQIRQNIMEGKVTSPKAVQVMRSFKESLSPSDALEAIENSEDISQSIFYVMGAFNSERGVQGPNVIYKFSTKNKSWTFVTNCPKPLHDVRMVSTSDDLYLVGGYSPLDRSTTGEIRNLKESYKYHLADEKWSNLPQMVKGRSLHGAVEFNGMILAIGGRDDENSILSSIEQYSPSNNSWEDFKQPLPQPQMGMGVASDGSSMWIAGGISSDGEFMNLLDSVWCFKKEEARWTKLAILPNPIAFPTLLRNLNSLMLIGGAIRTNREDKSQLESVASVLYLEDNSWSKHIEMPVQCHNAVAANYGETIYVFGGFRTQIMSQMTEATFFDINKKEWQHLCDLPEDASGFMVAISKYQS